MIKPDKSNTDQILESSFIPTHHSNYRLSSWPPSEDTPISFSSDGQLLSKFGDPIWRLDPWMGKPARLNFGLIKSHAARISEENALLLKAISAWWIWGPRAAAKASTLRARFATIRQLFVICTLRGILASSLSRYPRVIAEIAHNTTSSRADDLATLLRQLENYKEMLGFVVLDLNGLSILTSLLPKHHERQTAYIPPRIWEYQVLRLRSCLMEYVENATKVENCYRFCLEAYAHNYGSLQEALSSEASHTLAPFGRRTEESRGTAVFHGPFERTAEKFGILDLLQRWLSKHGVQKTLDISSLTSYLYLVSRCGLAYVLNFSLMRISEGLSLRTNCLIKENDPVYGPMFLLRARTTKTLDDEDDLWPTSPLVKLAIDAMSSIAHLQAICSRSSLLEPVDPNPLLIQRCAEPWVGQSRSMLHLDISRQTYRTELGKYAALLDPDELRITKNDLDAARRATPSLPNQRFQVGAIWPLAYHQLRRTGAVNMQASGVVSDLSLQYLLKHSTNAMSQYYARGSGALKLNEQGRKVYIQAMYEGAANELMELMGNRFTSPHGDKRKLEMMRILSCSELRDVENLVKANKIHCRPILLGYCMNRNPCPFGGVDSIAYCGGGATGQACPDVLYDIKKKEKILELEALIDERTDIADLGTPLSQSLQAQKKSIENYKNATNTDS